MKQVFKYPLDLIGIQHLKLPKYSKILCVKNQYDNIVLYAEVPDVYDTKETITIIIVGTGRPMPNGNLMYIGTVLVQNGTLVWHVYEKIK